jgi:hypothetical protein
LAVKGAADIPARSPFMLRPSCRTLRALSCSDPYKGVLHRGQEQGDQRWREIGFLGQVMHKIGVRRDHALGLNEGIEHMAVAALDTLEPRRAALVRELPEAEKVEAAAFGRAQPAAAAELAKRQELGNLAREIIAERRQEQDQGRERERSRDRDLGMER